MNTPAATQPNCDDPVVGARNVFEVKIMITLLAQDEDHARIRNDLSEMSLSSILNEMEDGEFIGIHRLLGLESLQPAEASAALKSLGSDDSFFDMEELEPSEGRAPSPPARIIDDLRADQGWNAETMLGLAMSFIREKGLERGFSGALAEQARLENDYSSDPEIGV